MTITLDDLIARGRTDGLTPEEARVVLDRLELLMHQEQERMRAAAHPKVDPFRKVIAFRGAHTGQLPALPPDLVHDAMQLHVAHRERLLRAALIEEGADPDTVAALGDPSRRREAEALPPIPQDILDRVSQRDAQGEFDTPVKLTITKEHP